MLNPKKGKENNIFIIKNKWKQLQQPKKLWKLQNL